MVLRPNYQVTKADAVKCLLMQSLLQFYSLTSALMLTLDVYRANLTLWSSVDINWPGWLHRGSLFKQSADGRYDDHEADDQVAAGRMAEDGVTAGAQDELQ